MTVLEVIQRSAGFLARKGVDSPRLQAELLLAHLLKLPRMKLYLNFERQLTSAEVDSLRDMVKRRAQREPLQHIVGSTSFCGLEMAVNRHVLIPRPETELLAEEGWTFLNQRSTALSQPDSVGQATRVQNSVGSSETEASRGSARREQALTALDFGTGSGCLAIALAVKSPVAEVHAIDVSPEALAVAKENAARHTVTKRLHFFQGDGFGALPERIQFDLLIGNPPYIPSADIEKLEPEVRDHDPRRALDGGADGMNYFRRLAVEAGPFLKPGGKMMLEFGDGQADAIRHIFQEQNWVVEALKADYSRRPRILIARRAE